VRSRLSRRPHRDPITQRQPLFAAVLLLPVEGHLVAAVLHGHGRACLRFCEAPDAAVNPGTWGHRPSPCRLGVCALRSVLSLESVGWLTLVAHPGTNDFSSHEPPLRSPLRKAASTSLSSTAFGSQRSMDRHIFRQPTARGAFVGDAARETFVVEETSDDSDPAQHHVQFRCRADGERRFSATLARVSAELPRITSCTWADACAA